MAHAFNLGWKLAAVLRGHSPSQLLQSYSRERQQVAHDLIAFDKHWAARFSESTGTKHSASAADDVGQSNRDSAGAMDASAFQAYFTEHGRYTAGVAVCYAASDLIANDRHQGLAQGLRIGMRFHSALVTRLADALPLQLAHTIRADGRWRLFIFADQQHPADQQSPVWQLCDFLAEDTQSPIKKFQRTGASCDDIIDVRVVFQ